MTNPEMKEMLELAANACGYEGEWKEWRTSRIGKFKCIEYTKHEGFPNWNPLTDDGDYSRMEAQLGIDTSWRDDHVTVWSFNCEECDVITELYSDHNNDKQAARRAAGTRLAAEIGRMK